MPNTTTRANMPSLYTVGKHWYLHGPHVDMGEPCCLACGWHVPDVYADNGGDLTATWRWAGRFLQRAHLADYSVTGSVAVHDIVPLCWVCHRYMPAFRLRAEALAWVDSRPPRNWAFQMLTDGLHERGHMQRKYDLEVAWDTFANEALNGTSRVA